MWFFRSPTIVFGEDSLCHLAELKGERAFVVADPHIRKKGLLGPVLIQLEHAGLQTTIFDAIEPEPSIETFEEGADAMDEFAPDWIVAVGGGSIIDAAKGMWALYENPDITLSAINPIEAIRLRKKANFVAIPTTAGTGSEATYAFVLSQPAQNGEPARKLGLGHPSLMPDIAIIDPIMTVSMPPSLTADTGMDALVQAIEGYVATWHNEFSDGLCLNAIKQIWDYLPKAYADGNDLEAREKVANAATMAGLGYINAMVGAAHSMAHAAGAIFNLPHGRACGLFLPYVIRFSSAANRPPDVETRYADIVQALGLADGAVNETIAGQILTQNLFDLLKQLKLPHSLSAAGIDRATFNANLTALIENASSDTVIFTAPRQPNEAELKQLFIDAYDGRNR